MAKIKRFSCRNLGRRSRVVKKQHAATSHGKNTPPVPPPQHPRPKPPPTTIEPHLIDVPAQTNHRAQTDSRSTPAHHARPDRLNSVLPAQLNDSDPPGVLSSASPATGARRQLRDAPPQSSDRLHSRLLNRGDRTVRKTWPAPPTAAARQNVSRTTRKSRKNRRGIPTTTPPVADATAHEAQVSCKTRAPALSARETCAYFSRPVNIAINTTTSSGLRTRALFSMGLAQSSDAPVTA